MSFERTTTPWTSRLLRRLAGLAHAAAPFEALEAREVLSAVSWDGGAATANWHDALNWSNDAVPTVSDDVTIGATALASINFTTTTGARSVNSLNSAENLTFSGGTLTVITTATTTAPVTLSGGTLSGGAWSPSSITASAGTLNNVALSGDLNVAAFGLANVTGSTTFNVAHLIEGADIRFAPGYTLNSTVRAEGTGGNSRGVSTTAAGTLTIGASGLIELAAGTAGGLNIGNGNTTLVNNGTIANNAAGRVITINATTTTNNNILSASTGTITINGAWTNAGSITGTDATLNFQGTWSTTGSVTINNTTLNLDGAFTTAGMDLPGFSRTGGTVNLTGTLTNSALTLNAGTGSWNLSSGGTINGGSLSYANGASLQCVNGTLNNVTVNGDINVAAFGTVAVTGTTTFNVAHLIEGADIRFAPGYTLNSTVRAEGTGGNTRQVLTTVVGTFTIGATGLVELAAGTGGSLNVGNASMTLINNGTIANNAAGRTLTVNASATTNNASLSASTGTLSITTNWSNPGTISASNATLNFNGTWSTTGSVTINNTTLNLDGAFTTAGMDLPGFSRTGGTVNLTGTLTNSALTLNAGTGSWNLSSGGTINGGSLSYANGASLQCVNGTLNNVTVNGDINVAAFGTVAVTGTTTFNVAHLIEGADIRFAPGYTLNSTVRAEGTGGNTRQVLTTVVGTFTIGATGLVELAAGTGGSLNVGNASMTLINNGTIANNAAGRTLTVNASATTNNASLSASTGTLSITTNWSNPGTISASNATLNFNGTWSTTGSVTINNTTLNLDGAFTTAGMDLPGFSRTGGTVNLTGTLTNSALTLNAGTGSWNLSSGGTINGGSLSYANGASLQCVNGTLNNVTVNGDINVAAFGTVAVTGTTTFNVAHLIEGADIRFAPGYTLNSTVRAEGTGGNTRQVLTTVVGTFTIGATGLVELAAGTAGGLNVGNASMTLINNGTIANNAAGRTLTVNASALSNLSGTTLTGGSWLASNGGTINLGTGRNVTINAAAVTISGATSSISGLTGLATNNGTLTLANTKDLAVGAFQNNGTLTLGAGCELTVTGAFTQSATGTLNAAVSGTSVTQLGRVLATGAVNLAGAWSVSREGSFIPAYGTIFDLVIGSTRSGNFTAFSSGAVPGGRFLELYSPATARAVFDRAIGLWTGLGDGINWSDQLNWFSNTIPGASDHVYIDLPASAPSILVNSGTRTVASVLSTESLTIVPGATLAVVGSLASNLEGAFTNNGVMNISSEAAASGGGSHNGTFNLSTGAILRFGGTHSLNLASSINGNGTVFVTSGTTTFGGSIAAPVALATFSGATAVLARDYSIDSIENAGALAIGAHSISLSGTYSQAASGTLSIDVIDASTAGSISCDVCSLDGTLDISASAGFDPSSPMLFLYGIDVINSNNAFGTLTVGAQPTLVVGSYVARTQGNTMMLLHNVADFNGDGGVDGDDVIGFFDNWDASNDLADVNGDGGVDGDDVIFFFQLWDNGGR